MADHDVEGQVGGLLRLLRENLWASLLDELEVRVETFASLGLAVSAPDSLIWQTCQARGVLLITANRNAEGPDSLEAAIREHNTPQSLPVFTLANLRRLRDSREYALRVAERLLECLLDIENYRGSGRVYLP
jgi:hypothetical protein